jgi:hypothetical protein
MNVYKAQKHYYYQISVLSQKVFTKVIKNAKLEDLVERHSGLIKRGVERKQLK